MVLRLFYCLLFRLRRLFQNLGSSYYALMSKSQTFQHLTVSDENTIGIITLSRPERANALSHNHLAELEQAALGFRDAPNVRAVIITGAGRHFSSGADLQDPAPPPDMPLVQRRRRARMGQRAIQAILNMDQITIAAWRGAAMGGGACVATACDFRVGSETAFIQYPEVDLGINLMWKSLPLILALVGPARAKRLVAGSERLDARTMADWGILDRLTPDEELMARAMDLASDYAAKPPLAVQMIKQSTNQLAYALGNSIMHMDSDQNLLAASSEDREKAIQGKLNNESTEFTGN